MVLPSLCSLVAALTLTLPVHAVTIYTDIAGVNIDSTATGPPIPLTTGNSAYSSLVLIPPAPPQELQTVVPISIPATGGIQGLSIPQHGNFLGFSVELSVAHQVLGSNSSFLSPIFLNYMANIKERAGHGAIVRVGGNSQDESVMYDEPFIDAFGRPQMIRKWRQPNANPTDTPMIDFAVELINTMGNITTLVDVDWYFGLAFMNPYNDSNALKVAQVTEEHLGQHLIALQLGNEPDLYANHQRRDPAYGIPEYFTEFQHVVGNLQQTPLARQKILLGPRSALSRTSLWFHVTNTFPIVSVCCMWTTDAVLDAGWLDNFGTSIAQVSVMHYPANNCGLSGEINPQDIYGNYLTHNTPVNFVRPYLSLSGRIQATGLPLVMLETNTASCGGFPGVSDSFASALWAIDTAMALAAGNFTTMLLHVGGQSDSYNPFTPPPTKFSKNWGWTTGPTYYSTLVVAEAFGKSNLSQIIDLNLPSEFQPGYAIYESGVPTKLALFNYVDNPTGASDYQAVYQPQGGAVPAQVYVRYLYAPSVAEKFNITWANQTLGNMMQSDGRLMGTPSTITIPCDATANTCTIPLKAPSFALVFLSDQSLASSSPESPDSTLTFATTAVTNRAQANFIAPSILATMQGHGGPGPRYEGSTGRGSHLTGQLASQNESARRYSVAGASLVALVLGGAFVVARLMTN